MERQFPTPVTCPVVIGRAQELAFLRMFVDRVHSGGSQVILVSGDAGIGKSRLVAEVKASAQALGFLLLEGQCFQVDDMFPYAPLLDLFHAYMDRLAREAPNTLSEPARAFTSILSRIQPELVLSFPDLMSFPAPPPSNPAEEKRHLFAAMTHFVREQAGRQPVLLVVEDIHWCDDLSLDLLLHLARRCKQVPFLLLVTYRSEELSPRLRRWLSQLDQERLARECSLEHLSRAHVATMLRAMLNTEQEIEAQLLDTLYTHSEGNPFFVEELLSSLISSKELVSLDGVWKRTTQRALVPRSVQEGVQQRLASLSVDAKQLVLLAAVIGRHFNVSLLQEAMHCDEPHLLTLLKETMTAQLVVEETADQFAFRHALTQQTIINSLLLRERQGLHQHLAKTLERLASSSPLFREKYLEELAYHFYAAGMWEHVLVYAQEAGEKALKLYAQSTAIDHFTHTIEAAQHLSQTTPTSLYLARGQAYETQSDFGRARSDYEHALATARTTRDSKKEWEAMIALGFLWTGYDYEQAGTWLQQAFALAKELGEPALHAQSLKRLGNWFQNKGRNQEAVEAYQEALHLFEMRADRQGMADTLGELGMASLSAGDPARAVQDFFEPAIELFRAIDDRQGLISVLIARALNSTPETIESTYSPLRTRDECMQDVEDALSLALQTNSPSAQAFIEIGTSLVLSSFGEFGPSLVYAQKALHTATTIEHQEWLAAANGALGQLYLLMLQPAQAIPFLEAGVAGAQTIGATVWSGYLTPYLALAYILTQEFQRAEATLKTILPGDQEPGTFFERQAARIKGELALAQGDAARALAIAEQLLASAPGERHSQHIPHLLALKGKALLALKRLEEAAAVLEDAKHGAIQRQAPSILWRIHCSLGQLYRLLKRENHAQREYSNARDIIARLTETLDEPPLREHFLQTALSFLPQGKSPSQEALTSSKYGGLSAREREVAALVAQGKSNREIAAALIVSERTAEAHVSNILGKLGLSIRAQIAVWAVEKGLLPVH